MQGILKHIISLVCVIFLTHIFISNFHKEDCVFDPVDTEDNAVISQGIATVQFQDECDLNTTKNAVYNPEQRSSKKAKDAKFVSFELIIPATANPYTVQVINTTLHTPSIPKNYCYLFFKEINPPPPKNC